MKEERRCKIINRIAGLAALCCAVLLILLSSSVRAEEYGEDAYGYLRILYENYSARVNNKEVVPNQDSKLAAGEWIDSMMTSFGYTTRTVTNEADMSRENGNFVKDYCYYKTGTGHTGKRIVIGAHYDSVNTSGTEDNGTGVAVLLEIAKRMKNLDSYLDVEFCFWDGEEYLGLAGSFHYILDAIQYNTVKDIVLYVNLDCVGSGDNIFVYGGAYEDNVLRRSFGYNMANRFAEEMGIRLYSLPPGLPNHHTPASITGSDQFFFNNEGIPYVYFACTAMYDENGNVYNPNRPSTFHTADPRVVETEGAIRGQIIHTVYDDLDTLEALFPGRIQRHFSELIPLVIRILRETDFSSQTVYADPAPIYLVEETATEEATTEEPTTEEATTEEETTEEETTEEETTEEESTEEVTTEEETAEEESTKEDPAEEETPEDKTAEETGEEASAETPDNETAASLVERIAIYSIIGLVSVWLIGLLIYLLRCRNIMKRKRRR